LAKKLLPRGVKTWTDLPFSAMGSKLRLSGATWEKANEAIIDYAISTGGRIHFNLAELNPSRAGLTAHELEYVSGNPKIRAATLFYGGPAPC